MGVLKFLNYVGAEKRFWRKENEKPIDLIDNSIKICLNKKGIERKDIDLLIYCSIDKGFIEPSNANIVASQLGFFNARCFDISDACMGWFSAIEIAYNFLKTESYSNALIISSEFPMDQAGSIIPENFIIKDFNELEYKIASLTIGECSTATLLSKDDLGDFNYEFISDSKNSHLCTIPFPNFEKYLLDNSVKDYFKSVMNFTAFGKEMNTKGRVHAKNVVELYLENNDMPDIFIPHSMSMIAIKSIAKDLNLWDKVHMTFNYLGNTASNSIPAGIVSAYEAGKIDKNSNILCCLGGAGFKYCAFSVKLRMH